MSEKVNAESLVQQKKSSARPIAAIDIGSNSVHLIVARICDNGTFEQLDSHKVVTRLAAHLDSSGKLTPEGIEVLLASLRRMKTIASGYEPDFKVIATHATRTAKNRKLVIDRVQNELGLSIEIIDGLEEARLAGLGMSAGLSIQNKPFIGLDIGGGSTEIVIRAINGALESSASLQLGTVALQKMFDIELGPSEEQVKRLQEILHFKLTPLASEIKHLTKDQNRIAVACSGTAKSVANLIHQMKFGKVLMDANAFMFTAAELSELTQQLSKMRKPRDIRERFQIEKDRSEVILVGTQILNAVTQHLGISKWHVSTFGLREGIIIDSANSAQNSTESADPRMESIKNFARRYRVDEFQAERVKAFCLIIYPQLRKVLPGAEILNKDESLLLRASSWLHEVGKFIAYSKYHKHSHYLISNGTLQGFTEKERLAIAAICRFHRKKGPHLEREEFDSFSELESQRIGILTGILRLATSLSRGRRDVIQNVNIKVHQDSLHIEILANGDEAPDVELARLEEEKDALEKTFAKKITFSKPLLS